MRHRWMLWVVLLAGLLFLLEFEADAQDASVGAALRSMAQTADRVFVGQVIAIVRKPGAVEVTFRVEQAVSGTPAASCTLREWAGLWPPGMQRYQVGDRAMVFVQAASAAGFATPVHGAEGVVPVLVSGPGSPALLDVSRLETRVLRSATTALSVAGSAIDLSDATTLVQNAGTPTFLEPKRLPLPTRERRLPPHMPVHVVPGAGELHAQPLMGAFDAR